jgi:hypothetical protein
MPVSESTQTPETAAVAAKVDASVNGFLSRDAWLAQSGKFKEKEITVEGLGKVLLMEISGAARAAIQSQQSAGLLSDVKRIDAASYQRALLLAGVADPSSPEGARKPMFTAGDMDRVMGIGGSKIEVIVSELETLSGMGAGAVASAEGNSEGTPSGAGTS